MKYTKEQVLKIVDCCFHMYASDYRNDAKDNAIEIMKTFDKQNLVNGVEQSASNCNIPLVNNSFPDFGFAEWLGRNYIRMNKVWCHRYVDQRDENNWKTSEQLYNLWINNI
jgi:hypothetical protein